MKYHLVQHRDGWCATKHNRRPKEGDTNVKTACRHVVVLPFGFKEG